MLANYDIYYVRVLVLPCTDKPVVGTSRRLEDWAFSVNPDIGLLYYTNQQSINQCLNSSSAELAPARTIDILSVT